MKNELGIKIRSIRKDRGITQELLAISCGVSSTYIGMVEHGNTDPTDIMVASIFKFLGSDIND